MDGFKRPTRPQQAPGQQPRTQAPVRPQPTPVDLAPRPATAKQKLISLPKPEKLLPAEAPLTPKKQRRSRLPWVIGGIIVFLVAAVVAAWLWYVSALGPVDPDDQNRRRITIEPGSSLAMVSERLQEEELIRSRWAFTLYARSIGAGARLQAGEYRLSPSESAQEIMDHLMAGSTDEFTLTFLPGATLRRLPGETSEQRTDVKSALLSAGYTDEEIEAAFAKQYDHSLFATKPASADLEGYIYGETYNFATNSTVEQVLEKTFDHYYKIIEENNLVQGFKKQGLTLHEGITLASVIQREVRGDADQKQVSQIFHDRLETDMSLGADATYEYAAKKLDVPATPQLDSPYNTRRFTGLPPGPIAVPGLSALIAAANPAAGDYLYFVSGDDGANHFARTLEEHEANVRRYCTTLCFGG